VDALIGSRRPGEECSMTDRKRRVFPEAFKREAVERVRTSGMTIIAVAVELGLHETVLRRWIARFGSRAAAAPSRRPPSASVISSPADLAAENARLKRELHRAEAERDILKKAAAAIVLEPMAHMACSSAGPPGDLRVRG
jgi:transposase